MCCATAKRGLGSAHIVPWYRNRGLLAVFLVAGSFSSLTSGTMYTGDIDTSTCWIQDQGFYEPFSGFERQNYFYPRDGYLNQDGKVPFYVYENEDTSTLKELCSGASNQMDNKWLELFLNHPWRAKKNSLNIPFTYVPTFAGPVLDGECGDKGLAGLKKLLKRLLHEKSFTSTNGHAFLHISTSSSVQDLLIRELTETIQEVHPGEHFDLERIKSDEPPDYLVPYVLNQMIAAERFHRPTLQFCQVYRPEFTEAYSKNVGVNLTTDFPFLFDAFAANRPVEYGIVEELTADEADRKFVARRKAFESLIGQNAIAIAVPIFGLSSPTVPGYETCPKDLNVHLVAGKAINCVLDSDHPNLSELRQKVLSKSQFAVITRGTFPHETNMYDAVQTNTLMINTIDKSIDMAMPYQCMVPWEEFTLRVSQKEFVVDPMATILAERGKYDRERLGKMLRLQMYYRPDVLFEPGFDVQSRVLENLLYTTLRRCTTTQITQWRNFTGHNTRCPFTDWAKLDIKPRGVHNVDSPPWVNM